MSRHKLSELAQIDRATQVAKPLTAQLRAEEPLSQAASTLPPHIIQCTESRKLNAQTPIFRCPAWADLPSRAWHLSCTRDGRMLPALGLHRYPFYLFGKSSACDYVLEHPSISSAHAALIFHKQHECFVLVDLGSTNGSRVNGKLVERQKPVPVPAGSIIQFGYSSRKYEVKIGAPPRKEDDRDTSTAQSESARQGQAATKHQREENTKETARPLAQPPSAVARTEEDKEEDHPPPPAPADGRVPDAREAEISTCAHEEERDAAGEEGEAPLEQVHLYHLVIKHKDVENATSRAERNKGEVITRSKQDAVDVANFILSSHAAESGYVAERGNKAHFDHWTVEQFIAAVEAYSEMATSRKKKAPGDLGMVERGTFSDEFDSAAFALRREEVSTPVETPLGIHLIYRCD